MCARYTPGNPDVIADFYVTARYLGNLSGSDIFPSHSAPIVIDDGARRIEASIFSLLPRGIKDNSEFFKKYSTFNAKSESLETSKMYGPVWKAGKRCIIPVVSFTEWRGEKGKKERLHIHNPNELLTSIAGIYHHETKGFKSFSMLTTAPNDFMSKLHHRMPAILSRSQVDEWLSPDTQPEDAMKLLRPFGGELVFEEAEK